MGERPGLPKAKNCRIFAGVEIFQEGLIFGKPHI
jgi:hypothetical protein